MAINEDVKNPLFAESTGVSPFTAAAAGETGGLSVKASPSIKDLPSSDSLPASPSKNSASARWKSATSKVKLANAVSGVFKTLRDQVDVNEIELSQLKTLSKLGEGAFAVVEKCEYTDKTGVKKTVAVKKLKPDIVSHPAEVQSFENEVNLLRKIHHKYIVQYIGIGSMDTSSVEKKKNSMFLVQELMPGGTFKKLVMAQMTVPHSQLFKQADALRWCIQIAEALAYIHEAVPQVIHRDLKLENILLTDKNPGTATAKLADFGLAAFLRKAALVPRSPKPVMVIPSTSVKVQETTYNESSLELMKMMSSSRVKLFTSPSMISSRSSVITDNLPQAKALLSGKTGSLMYMSPEMYRNSNEYTEKVDVFSFGVVMYELLHKYSMIVAISIKGTEEEIEMYAERVSNGYRPPIHDNFPTELKTIISACMAQEPSERPSMRDVAKQLLVVQEQGLLTEVAPVCCSIS